MERANKQNVNFMVTLAFWKSRLGEGQIKKEGNKREWQTSVGYTMKNGYQERRDGDGKIWLSKRGLPKD
jgi:hypothetical protein